MRVATDIGGTFTDLVYVSPDGRVGLAKSPSTPPHFSQGVLDVIRKAGIDPGQVEGFVHGSTVVINALTERKGARTGLVTTRGFRDVLAIGRANRPDMYNMRFRKQAPFVPRQWRYEVTERIDYRGRVVTPLDEGDVRRVADQIAREGLEAVAVCFLHSYANPAHEQRCAELLRELLPGVAVSASHEITMEWREYERKSTVVLNAYVRPAASRYLERLESELKELGIGRGLEVMKSNGGTTPFAVARKQPIHLVESGPVAGVIGAQAVARRAGVDNIITLDIGGTTAKTSLVEAGQVRITTDYRIERDGRLPGYPIKVPVVDIVEIGAGGGSIARIDEAGAVRIGPKSAGSVPGPACYGRGGTQPTVTDANLLTGRLNPAYFLAGDLRLDPDKAKEAIRPLAERFGLPVEEAALGILRVANASMVNAIKLVSVRRGYDPRDFTLVAFGGGGPLHAAALAQELHIRRVLIPPAPGTFSALGMLATRPVQDFVRTRLLPSADEHMDQVKALFAAMKEEALAFMAASGFDPSRVHLRYLVDMRYRGQEHTVRVPVAAVDRQEMEARFHELHEQAYTFRLDSPVELVNFHVSAVCQETPVDVEALAPAFSGDGSPKGRRNVLFEGTGWVSCPVYERANLVPDRAVEGPAIIEEPTSTAVVHPGQRARVDELGNILVETGV
ncbi:MAG: hydantoinase/oxoprolinase family protein [Firmicutes bacterium]|nr:hydantoinase/oxoprolinase family protein [Bacillota bacterium]